jgi:chemotaxis signal transduction protein
METMMARAAASSTQQKADPRAGQYLTFRLGREEPAMAGRRKAGDIENTPDFGSGAAIPYLLGMAKIKGQVKILLDINRVLSAGQAAGLGSL